MIEQKPLMAGRVAAPGSESSTTALPDFAVPDNKMETARSKRWW
jgi:hypothetical protein